MSKLTSAQRNALPAKEFALPGGRYPIENASHARNALSRVSANGTAAEKAEVRAAVHRKYPGIGQDHDPLTHALVDQEILKQTRRR